MQRTLAYALSPSPTLPLVFLLTAPWFGVLAALLLAVGEGGLTTRWSGTVLGTTHLLTLGYLGMTMTGSLLQMVPVVAGVAIPLRRILAATLWCALAGGALLLACALATGSAPLFAPAAALLTLAFAILLVVMTRAVWRPVPTGARPMVDGMRLALGGLAVTAVLGVLLALSLAGRLMLPLALPRMADLHAAWGLVGWVAMLVACVAFQVIPMFQSSRLYPPALTRWGPRLLATALLLWSTVWLAGASDGRLAGIPAALTLIVFAAVTGSMIASRKGKQMDVTTRYWWLSLPCLAASALLYLMPSGEQLALATGVLFIGGFAMGVVNGMLYKIVAFLLWYHLQQDPRAARGLVPPLRLILDDGRAQRQFWCHCAALAAMLAATRWPAQLTLPAAGLMALACLLLACDLGRASLHGRRLARALQPS